MGDGSQGWIASRRTSNTVNTQNGASSYPSSAQTVPGFGKSGESQAVAARNTANEQIEALALDDDDYPD